MTIVALKTLLDIFATFSFAFGRQWPMALTFAGFTLADAGLLWVALK